MPELLHIYQLALDFKSPLSPMQVITYLLITTKGL